MDRPLGHHAKWNKTEKGKYCMISLICGILKKKKKQANHEINIWIGGCQKWGGGDKMGEDDQKVEISSNTINKS